MCWSKPGGSSSAPYDEGILDALIAPLPFRSHQLVSGWMGFGCDETWQTNPYPKNPWDVMGCQNHLLGGPRGVIKLGGSGVSIGGFRILRVKQISSPCIECLGVTLPKTNSSPLKMDGWNTFSFPFGARPIFRGYVHAMFAVSFREGNS